HCVQGGWRDAAESSRRMVGNAHGRGGADPGLYLQLLGRVDNRKSGYARGGRHRCAKILAVVPHVEIFLSNCIGGSQIVLHTRRSLPCWRIVFSTFRECMSFHTGAMIAALCPMSASAWSTPRSALWRPTPG